MRQANLPDRNESQTGTRPSGPADIASRSV
jgi:hypothetical protein